MRESFPSVTLAMVMSLDGRTSAANGTFPASAEDQEHFRNLKRTFPYLLIGRGTWQVNRAYMTSAPPTRLVFTRSPKQYAQHEIPGVVEFTDNNPQEALRKLARRGVDRVLLAGGSALNAEFLRAGLITDCLITIEPTVVGSGNPLFAPPVPQTAFRLESMVKLNAMGTLLMRYTVLYDHPGDTNR